MENILEDTSFKQTRQDMLPSQGTGMKPLMGRMGQMASSCHKLLQKSGLDTSLVLKVAPISTFVIFCHHKWWPPNCCDCIHVTSRGQRASLHNY